MAIVKLKKMTLCGLLKEKQCILEKLQKQGGAHLIPLTEQLPATGGDIQKQSEKTIIALKYLNQCPKKRHQVKDADNFVLPEITEQVLTVKTEIRRISDQRDFLINRIAEIEPWGDFSLSEQGSLGSLKLWFYIVPKRLMNKLSENTIFQVVHQDNIHCYVVVLSETEPAANSMPVTRTHTGAVALSQLKKNLQQLELQLEDMQAERESLTRWITLLTLSLFKNEDIADLKIASTMTLDQYDIFALQAWIPENDRDRFEEFAKETNLAILIIDPEPGDKPPTLLENAKPLSAGEDIIGFYQTPGYFDWDPSAVVFFSFALFFAMILSDAGYAITLALLVTFKWKNLGRSLKGRRLRLLFFVTILFSLVWGMLVGSYFGFIPTPGSIAATVNILNLNDFDSMMQFSIAVGTTHIVFANLIKAYQKKHSAIAWASIGWAITVMGGFIYWLASQTNNDVLQRSGIVLFVSGLILVLLLSSGRNMKKPVDLLWRLLEGVKNLTGVTRIFGDILSYMRLFALGLASASLALTFNHLAIQVYHSVSGLGLLLSILILLLGHTLNLLLCLMSGVVHGLRLNFIEFYNWSISDEGYPFKAFSRKGAG